MPAAGCGRPSPSVLPRRRLPFRSTGQCRERSGSKVLPPRASSRSAHTRLHSESCGIATRIIAAAPARSSRVPAERCPSPSAGAPPPGPPPQASKAFWAPDSWRRWSRCWQRRRFMELSPLRLPAGCTNSPRTSRFPQSIRRLEPTSFRIPPSCARQIRAPGCGMTLARGLPEDPPQRKGVRARVPRQASPQNASATGATLCRTAGPW